MIEGIPLVIWQVILSATQFENHGRTLDDLAPVEKFGAVFLDQLAAPVAGIEATGQDGDE